MTVVRNSRNRWSLVSSSTARFITLCMMIEERIVVVRDIFGRTIVVETDKN